MNRRGGILLEVIISITIVASAGAFVLSTISNSTETLSDASLRRQAMDEAQSLLSLLDAGMVNLGDLREGSSALERDARFVAKVDTSRSSYRNLTLVTILITDRQNPDRVYARLRELIQLRPEREPAPEQP